MPDKKIMKTKIFEAEKLADGKLKFPVVIISQGLGNLGDRNYYSKEAILSAPAVYEGKKAYFDHPTERSQMEQPGRSVRETCGHYEDCKVDTDENGMLVLKAFIVPESDAITKIQHAVEYKKKYPNSDYIGISINGDGEGVEMEYDEFVKTVKPTPFEMQKISQIEGQPIVFISKLTDAVSADLVTEAGARGRFLLESKNKNSKKGRSKMLEAFKKFFTGIDMGNKSLVEEAVKDMLQADGDDKAKEDAAKEDAALEAEAGSMAKAMLQAKKDNQKYESESESEYEARCMKQAMKDMKAAKSKAESEAKEAADKEALGAEEAKKEGDDEKKDDKSEEKKEAASDDKKDDKEEKSKEGADDKDAMIAKLKKENEELKAKKESAESEKQEAKMESAQAKIKLKAKEREELIDKTLAESGLPRVYTKEIRSILEGSKTKEDMKAIVGKFVAALKEKQEEIFFTGAQGGFTEITTSESSKTNNDNLF